MTKKPIYPKIYIGGLDAESQLSLVKALAEAEEKERVKAKSQKVIS